MTFCPVKANSKYQKIQWINTIVHVHDLQCECDKPLEHTTYSIFEQEKNLRFTEQQKQLIRKCLTTKDDSGHADDAPFGDGELEALFSEDPDDTGKPDATTATDIETR